MKKFFLFLAAFALASPLFADVGGAMKQQNITQTVLMVVIAVGFFYFILWRPESKRRKKMQTLRDQLKKGDQVTAMGIVGSVVKINEKTVILSMVDGAKIEMLRAAITEVHPAMEKATQEAKSSSAT